MHHAPASTVPSTASAPRDRTASPAGPTAPDRLRWPDVAKGICIVLVVLWHVVLKHYQQVDWHTALPFSAAWGVVGDQLLPLRMPLFFTVSGFFAVRAIDRSWSDLLRTRIGRFLALYVIWVVVHTVVFAATPTFRTPHAEDPGQLLAELTVSPTNLWYLFALGLYFAIAKAARRVPTPWLLAGALLLSAIGSTGVIPNVNNRWQVLQNLVFFLAASRLAPRIRGLADRATWRRALVLLGCSGAATSLMAVLGAEQWVGVRPAVSVLAAVTGITVAALVAARCRRAGALLGGLGRRTLGIYVLHLPVLAVLDAALRGPLHRFEPHDALLAAIDPVLVTAAAVVLSILIARCLRQLGLGRLLDPLARRTPSVRPMTAASA